MSQPSLSRGVPVEGPAAQPTVRVPRTMVDSLWQPGVPSPAVRVISGVVSSIDSEDTCTCTVAGDESLPGVLFLGTAPTAGDIVEIEMRGDLYVIVSDPALDLFIEGMASDAQHIVDDSTPVLPPGTPVNIGGSMLDNDAWYFPVADQAAWSHTTSELGMDVFQQGVITATTWDNVDPAATWDSVAIPWNSMPGGGAAVPTATLWSTTTFLVKPGQALDFDALVTYQADTPKVQFAVCYGTDTVPPDPEAAGQVVLYPPELTVTPAMTFDAPGTLTSHGALVPSTLASGALPTVARVGIKCSGTGTARMTLRGSTLSQRDAGWPIGSLWMNPAAGEALPTIGSTDLSTTGSGGTLAAATVFTTAPNAKKALVTAPPTTGGIVLAIATGTIVGTTTNNVTMEMQHQFIGGGALTPASAVAPMSRINSSMVSPAQLPMTVVGWCVLPASATVEIDLMYRYASAPGATVMQLRGHSLVVVFIPQGIRAGDPGTPDPMSYWDGDSWREGTLKPALMDLTKPNDTPEPAKLASNTAITVPAGPFEPGDVIALSATVTPTPAVTGTVTFQRSTSSGGPWTTIATVALDAADKAVKNWTAVAGTWFFRALYNGDTVYATSNQVSGSRTVSNPVHTVERTFNAQWVMPYNGGGSQKGGGSFAGDVYCGFFDNQTGNQKSMIQFLPNLPGDADVTKVELICDDWDFWRVNHGGLVVGWHENKGGSAPNQWTNTHADQSDHSPGEGKFTVNITGWASTKVTRSDFGGITIGPGDNNSDLYNGNCIGKQKWSLRITYKTAT